MNGLPYYKAYPRDFLEGTIGMSFEEKGAYRLVLDLIYMQGGNLPDDARYISGHLGCTVRKWNMLRERLISLGKIAAENGIISNFRARNELETLRKFQDKQRENASGPRKNNELQKPRLNHTEPDTYTDTEKKKNPSGKKKSSISDGFPDRGAKEAAKAYWQKHKRLDLCDRVDRTADAFAGHHAAKGSRFVDWGRAWQTWYVNQVDMTKPPAGTPSSGPPVSKRDEERARLQRFAEEGFWIDTIWGSPPTLPDGTFNELYEGNRALAEEMLGLNRLPFERKAS